MNRRLRAKPHATTALRVAAVFAALSLALPALVNTTTQSCRSYLMRNPELGQLYARGDGMGVRINFEEKSHPFVRTYRVEKLAVDKLRFQGLFDTEANQWLDINLNLDRRQFAILISLRRWSDDMGYGVPGEITVWGLGGGGQHHGSGWRVLERLGHHVDDFIALYRRAQRACTM